MYMIFVDESGDTGYPADGNWAQWGGSKLYTRVGAVIHGWKWKTWNERLILFKRNRGLSWDVEIKAAYVRQGKGGFTGWDKARRDLFLSDLLDLIGSDPDITLFGIAIDKTNVDVSQSDRFKKPDVRSMELLLERYNFFLKQQRDKSGIVVLDPTREKNDDNIRYFQSYLQANANFLQPLHIVEGTFFAKSHTSNMIQIADICSNVFFRNETGASNSRREFSKIYPRFWRHNRKIQGCGIKKWP